MTSYKFWVGEIAQFSILTIIFVFFVAENNLEIQISKSETNSKFKCFNNINKDNP